MIKKNPILNATVILLVLFIIVNNFIFLPINIISWDVFGYYLYLPTTFIYHDPGLKDLSIVHHIIDKYQNTDSLYQITTSENGQNVFKYTMGLAILYAPFFFLGHMAAALFHFPADGFSLPYQYAIFACSLFYAVVGIIVTGKVLARFFRDGIAACVLIIIVFATNYLVHITMYGGGAYTHNFLFTGYALILWLTVRWHESHKLKLTIFMAITCGIMILMRPTEIVCLLIPLFWSIGDRESYRQKIKLLVQYRVQFLIFFTILCVAGSLQFVYWKIQTGHFFFNSYDNSAAEGLDFRKPHIGNVLFSFRKGWLIYTPVMFFAIGGLFVLYQRNRQIFIAIFLFTVFNIYLISCWSCWWYAQSFSQRPMVSSYPVMAILLGYFISWLVDQKWLIKLTGIVMIFLCMALNLFQTLQFRLGIINGDRMTRSYYGAIFGRLQVSEADKELLLIRRSSDGKEDLTNENNYHSRIIKIMGFETASGRNESQAHSGKYSYRLDQDHIYSPPIEFPHYDITMNDYAWIRITAYVYPVNDGGTNPFNLVVHYLFEGRVYKYATLNSDKMNLQVNQWNKVTFNYLTPDETRLDTDIFKAYFWLRGKDAVYIDDMMVEVFEKNN